MQRHGEFDTGVEVGRDDTALRRAEPGRSGVRSLAARVLTVALLAALAALAALHAPPLQAQTVTTFVSNTHLTPTSSGSVSFQAQSFETGANAGGYTVSEVDIFYRDTSGKSTSVKIRENNSSDEPGDLVATLTNRGTLTDDSPNTFTAPAGTTLAASTTYYISVNEGITSDRASLGVVSADDETGETSWSIGDGRLVRTDETNGWGLNTFSLLIAIKGTAITTFVSNTHYAESTRSNDFHAQRFKTGANAGGYTVSEVDILLPFNSVSGKSTSVKIRENNASDEPGDLVATLTNPDTFTASSLNTFTAPAGTTLDPSEPYWITMNEGITSDRLRYAITNDEDQTGETGWTIGNRRLRRTDETSDWSSSGNSLMIAIKGTSGGTTTLSTDATLSGLALEDGDGNAIALDTDFASDDYEYEVSVANGIDAVKLTATKNDSSAMVVITDDDDVNTPDEAELDLSVGSNTLTVTVTAEDTSTEELTYTVTVTRREPYVCAAPDLSGRSEVWSGTVTVGTDGSTYGYQSGTDAYGALSDTDFDYGGNDYIIEGITQLGNTALAWVKIDLDSSFPDSDRSKLSLHICDGTFTLTSAIENTVDNDYTVLRIR